MLWNHWQKAVAYACIRAGLAVLMVLVVSACASRARSPEPASSATALPAISMRRSGGIAGVNDVVTVDSTGAWTVTDKSGAQRTGQLDTGRLAALIPLATDPKLAAEAGRVSRSTKCADAFNYQVTVGALRVTYTDCPADPDPPTAAMALVRKLRQLTES